MVVAPRYLNGTKSDVIRRPLDTQAREIKGCVEGLQEVGYFHQIKNGVDYVRLWTILRTTEPGYSIPIRPTKPLAITSSDTSCC